MQCAPSRFDLLIVVLLVACSGCGTEPAVHADDRALHRVGERDDFGGSTLQLLAYPDGAVPVEGLFRLKPLYRGSTEGPVLVKSASSDADAGVPSTSSRYSIDAETVEAPEYWIDSLQRELLLAAGTPISGAREVGVPSCRLRVSTGGEIVFEYPGAPSGFVGIRASRHPRGGDKLVYAVAAPSESPYEFMKEGLPDPSPGSLTVAFRGFRDEYDIEAGVLVLDTDGAMGAVPIVQSHADGSLSVFAGVVEP